MTKRHILKVIAIVFDPLGFLQPVVMKFKILFQEICSANIDWDDFIGEESCKKWHIVVNEMKNFVNIAVKHCYFDNNFDNIEKVYFHGFLDASEAAYAACVYIKYVTKAGNIGVKLISSKSRVVPIKKKFTIPRLELLGNLIVANLSFNVYNVLKDEIKIDDYFCWTDLTICLALIKSVNKEYKTFVENRLIKIRSRVKR